MKNKVKVLIVDDSAIFRQLLSKTLSADPAIEVIATAADPYIAASKMTMQVPDVITLDLEMPRMNGITFLKKIMSQHPIPVIIITGRTGRDMEVTLKALEHGAVEVLSKDMFDEQAFTAEARDRICEIVKSAALTKLARKSITEKPSVVPKLSADAVLQFVKPKNQSIISDKVIAVGASTGGTEAIRIFLEALPVDIPGIVIVQHMPENFTRLFAERLNSLCKITVKEAEDGDLVKPGTALIAPGNRHLLLKRRGSQYYVELSDSPLVNRHRPAVDVLFRSTAIYAGQNGIGIILTGMGDDGARGLLEIKQAGGRTIAQDESSCVVFGMPKEAIMLNAADKVLPLKEISRYVVQLASTVRYI